MKVIITLSILLFTNGFILSQSLRYSISSCNTKFIHDDDVTNIKTLKDLNAGYAATWIKPTAYKKVAITVSNHTFESYDDTLTVEQYTLIQNAKTGNLIEVDVSYEDQNAATELLELRTINFNVTLLPAQIAVYKSGQAALDRYFTEQVISKIEDPSFKNAKFSFMINEQGKPSSLTIIHSTGNRASDDLILEAILNMPNWNPAKDKDGDNISQYFEFSLDPQGC